MISVIPTAIAHKNDQHYMETEKVLFGTRSATILADNEKKKLIRHLEYATSIALDQFNGSNTFFLMDLQQFHVSRI